MQGLYSNPSAAAYTACAFGFQLLLCIHFALRRWRFSTALRWGWIVYALGLPAGLLGVYGLVSGAEWSWGVAGLLYLVWGLYGWWVEYRRRIVWRDPWYWPVAGPYLMLFLAVEMFYWFPLALIARWLWYAYGGLFLLSFGLNLASHHPRR